MEKPKSRDNDPRRERLKKRAAVSTNGQRPSKVALTVASSSTSRMEDISVARRRVVAYKGVEVEHIEMLQDVKEGAFLLLLLENPDVVAHLMLVAKYFDARRFWGVAQSWAGVEDRKRGEVPCYGVWRLVSASGRVRAAVEHRKDEIDTFVLHDKFEAVSGTNLSRFMRGVEASRHPEDWLWHCMRPWSHHTLPFLNGSKVWRNATKFE